MPTHNRTRVRIQLERATLSYVESYMETKGLCLSAAVDSLINQSKEADDAQAKKNRRS